MRVAENRIKIMNEYTVAWPVWNEPGETERDDLRLSESLVQRLERWARSFNDHFDWETGWDDRALTEPHRLEAHELHRLVSAELGPEYRVLLDLWEA